MELSVKTINDQNVWENFNLSVHPNNFLQSWNWGETHRRLGKEVFRWGVYRHGRLKAIAQVIEEEAKRGRHWLIPGGPVLHDWGEQSLFEFLIKHLQVQGDQRRIVFIRVRPNVAGSPQVKALFKKFGFIRAPMHLHAQTTLHLNIAPSEEELLMRMRKNTRYGIRRAEKEGVRTQVSQDRALVNILHRLQAEVVERQRFVPFSKEFFQSHFESFLKDNQIVFISSVYRQKVLAIGMFVFYGDTASYHYSGSSSGKPQVFASYAMLWRAIREAKKRGCRIFDFWGIAPVDDPRHRFAGVTLFKKGFGGERVDYLGARDLPLSFRYWPTYVFESVRRKVRRL